MRSINDVRIVTKLTAAFGSLAAVTVGISAIGYSHLTSIERVNHLTEHTYQVISALDGVTQSMLNQETGLRGYLLSGDPKFLEPFRNGQRPTRRRWRPRRRSRWTTQRSRRAWRP